MARHSHTRGATEVCWARPYSSGSRDAMEFVEAQANLNPERPRSTVARPAEPPSSAQDGGRAVASRVVADDANVRGADVARLFEGSVVVRREVNQLRLGAAAHRGRRRVIASAWATARIFEKLLADKRERLGAQAALYLTLKLAELQLELGELRVASSVAERPRHRRRGQAASDAAAGDGRDGRALGARVAEEQNTRWPEDEKFYQAGRATSDTPLGCSGRRAARAAADLRSPRSRMGDGASFGEVGDEPRARRARRRRPAWHGGSLSTPAARRRVLRA